MRSLLTILLLSSFAHGQGVTRPDFSGAWILDGSAPVAVKGDRAAMLGEKFTAKQDLKTLTLAISAFGRQFNATYNLDGSDSRLVSPGSPGQPDEVIISRATWEGDRLVIRTKSSELRAGKPVDTESRRVMWIDTGGLLILERTGTPADLVPTTVSVYRRATNGGVSVTERQR